jgi:pimeloyl-ACP methyl ester carboxylesterase
MPYADERQFDPWGWWSDIGCHLLLELGLDSAYVLGVGGGARAAMHFAGHHARLHELTALGVIADSFLADLDARALHRALDRREHYHVRYSKLLQREHGDDWREVVDAETAYLRRIADRGGYAVPDVVMNSVACPVLLTGHMKDPLTPGIAREYARLAGIIPDCSIHLAGTAGHPYIEYPWMWSNPEGFRAVADRFLASLT